MPIQGMTTAWANLNQGHSLAWSRGATPVLLFIHTFHPSAARAPVQDPRSFGGRKRTRRPRPRFSKLLGWPVVFRFAITTILRMRWMWCCVVSWTLVASCQPVRAFDDVEMVEPLRVARARGPIAEAVAASALAPGESKREQLGRIFTPDLVGELWMEDYADLDAACETGWLVDVPDDPTGLGVSIRKRGRSPVGERESDPVLRAKLYRLAKPAAGLLYRIAAHLKQLEGKAFVPVEVTSLVRPWSYQRRLMRTNPNADVIKAGVPPTHVFGLAFDIPRINLSPRRERALEAYLKVLADQGKIVFFKEGRGQSTFHVLALPAANAEFESNFHAFVAAAASSSGREIPQACEDVREAMLLEDTLAW